MSKFYWEVTAYTPYCGEELTEYCVTETAEKPLAFGDALIADCAAEWGPDFENEYENFGYDSAEDYEESYYADCYCEYRLISEEDYKFYTKNYYHG